MSFCSKCGFENPPGARFCSRCGAPLNDVPGPGYGAGMSGAPRNNNSKLIYIVGAVVIVLLLAVLLWVSFGVSRQDDAVAVPETVAVIPGVTPSVEAIPAVKDVPEASAVQHISMDGIFYYDGGEYPFTISFDYNPETGRASSGRYRVKGQSAKPKISAVIYTEDSIEMTGPETYIGASGSPDTGYYGQMRRVDHYGSCSLTKK